MLVHNGFVSVTGWVLQCSHHGNLNIHISCLNATDQSYHSSLITTGHQCFGADGIVVSLHRPIITMNPYNNNKQSYETYPFDIIKPINITIPQNYVVCLSPAAIDLNTISFSGVYHA